MQPAEEFWRGFGSDPRDPAVAPLRCADSDRDHVHELLTEAFVEGRLGQEEYDQRVDDLQQAKTFGRLREVVADLVPTKPPPARTLANATPGELQKQAEAAYQKDLREALQSFVVPSLITVAIWAVVMFGQFFWPAFVIIATGAHLLHTRSRKDEIVAAHRRRLEKKQLREQRGNAWRFWE